MAGTASTIGNVAGTVGAAAQTANQVGALAGKFGFKKKDKACNDVPKKNIEIGEHPGQPASTNTATAAVTNIAVLTTVINIQKINLSALRAFTDTLRTKAGVQSVTKAYTESASTVTVTHSGSTDALADWISDKLGNKFSLVNYDNGKINLAMNQKSN